LGKRHEHRIVTGKAKHQYSDEVHGFDALGLEGFTWKRRIPGRGALYRVTGQLE